jgi:hypothetical protein
MGSPDLPDDYHPHSHFNGNPDQHAYDHAHPTEFTTNIRNTFSGSGNNNFTRCRDSTAFPHALRPHPEFYILLLYDIFTSLIYSML